MKKIDEMRQSLITLKEEVRNLLDDNKVEDAESKMSEVRSLEKKIRIQEEIDEQEEREVDNKMTKENKKEERKMDDKNMEYRAIGKFLLGKELTEEERASVNVGNSGAILPQGFVNQVQVLTNGFPSLKKYAHVIPVITNTGKMPVSSGSTTKKLAKLATDTELVKEMITTAPVEYAVEDYGKIIPVENSVLDDTTVDFFNGLIAPDFAECAVNSENEAIIDIVEANATAFTATDYKGIAKCLNTKIKPSLLKNTVILTNQSGYDYLDSLTVSSTDSRPLLSDSLAVEGGKTFKGREVIVMDDTELPAATDKKVFYVVNLYALVKFFDRKTYEIATSKEAGFTYNQTFVRCIERFDAVKGDDRACFKIEF